MPIFDVWIKNKKTLSVAKVSVAQESHISGSMYLASITSSTKAMALKQAQSSFNSGIIKLPKPPVIKKKEPKKESKKIEKPQEIKKSIYCDFNGVLNDEDKHSNSDYACFTLIETSCPHKVYKLAKLALKHSAEIVMISEWRKQHITYDEVFYRVLKNSGIKEYIDFIEENDDELSDLTCVNPTEDFGQRTDEVRKHIKLSEYSHWVVFEDTHPIDSDLNLIKTQWGVGLLDEHIERADLILSEPF
jgi:hypothetical protein